METAQIHFLEEWLQDIPQTVWTHYMIRDSNGKSGKFTTYNREACAMFWAGRLAHGSPSESSIHNIILTAQARLCPEARSRLHAVPIFGYPYTCQAPSVLKASWRGFLKAFFWSLFEAFWTGYFMLKDVEHILCGVKAAHACSIFRFRPGLVQGSSTCAEALIWWENAL